MGINDGVLYFHFICISENRILRVGYPKHYLSPKRVLKYVYNSMQMLKQYC